jgi:hypothetical protein
MPETTSSSLRPAPAKLALIPSLPLSHLLATAQAATTRELARTSSTELREVITDMSIGLTHEAALKAPKIRDYVRQHDRKIAVNLLVILLRSFVDTARVNQRPDASDLMETADELVEKYPCESIEDFVLAFKQVRTRGVKLYDSLDSGKIHGFVNEYFERKAQFLENRHKDQKATSPSHDTAVAALIANEPQIQTMVQQQLDPTHPNHDTFVANSA